MAGTTTAARRYAEAVFELAQESGSLDQWKDDLDVLANVAGDGGALGVLENIKTPMEDRLGLLDRALTGMSPLAQNLARLLVSRRRFSLVPQIATIYGEMLDDQRGVVRAEAITAVPLSDDERDAIVDRLRAMTGARDIRIESRVDPSIIGGLIVRVGDQLIDGSTRSRLVQLRRQLAGVAP
jgi:F-type H+-transporting ATPase subunit delta